MNSLYIIHCRIQEDREQALDDFRSGVVLYVSSPDIISTLLNHTYHKLWLSGTCTYNFQRYILLKCTLFVKLMHRNY